MVFFSDEKIEEVKEAVDIVELVSHYVSLKRAGTSYKGLCPFHNEKTPSFVVTPYRRMFHCFGCGVGGSAIRFFMLISGLSFPEAMTELARRYGVDLPEADNGGLPQRSDAPNKPALYEALRAAREFYERQLWSPTGLVARNYLKNRNLDGNVAREFGLGLSLDSWNGLFKYLTGQGFGEKALKEAGLIKAGRDNVYDTFRNRVMVPIIDAENRVVAFGGRLLSADENQPKYLNSPETAVYKKGRLLYGYNRARPFLRAAGLVFLVEGYFDLISMAVAGINEVVATLGTALTSGHLNLLRGHVSEVMLLFDADEAGRRAAARALPLLLNAELDGRVVTLPDGHDPDTFVREFGTEALYEAASQSRDILDFYVARLKNSHPDTLAGQARMAREVKELLGQVPESAKSQLLRRRLAQMLDVGEEVLGGFKRPESDGGFRQLRKSVVQDPGGGYDEVAGALLRFIMTYPETAPEILPETAAWWPKDESRLLLDKLKAQLETEGAINPEKLTFDESEGLSSLVSEAVLAEKNYTAAESASMAHAYVERLRGRWRRDRQQELSAAIKTAQAKGDDALLGELLAEKNSLLFK